MTSWQERLARGTKTDPRNNTEEAVTRIKATGQEDSGHGAVTHLNTWQQQTRNKVRNHAPRSEQYSGTGQHPLWGPGRKQENPRLSPPWTRRR